MSLVCKKHNQWKPCPDCKRNAETKGRDKGKTMLTKLQGLDLQHVYGLADGGKVNESANEEPTS